MNLVATITFLAAALGASANTIRVDVGQAGLSFTPSSIAAVQGDLLEFHFHAINHSVAMSDFSTPCTPSKTGGFFSGFMPVSTGEGPNVFQVVINSTDPIFFYCAQNVGSHCASGMSGVVNPSGSQTLATYQTAAQSVSSAVAPNSVFGGVIAQEASSGSPTTAATAPTCTPGSSSNVGGYKRSTNPCTNGGGSLASPLGMLFGAFGVAYFML